MTSIFQIQIIVGVSIINKENVKLCGWPGAICCRAAFGFNIDD